MRKGETLHDTIRMLSSYADAIVLRHPNEGAARLAAQASDKPVINAGDGAGQHPTQTLLDLATMQEAFSTLSGLRVVLMGDLEIRPDRPFVGPRAGHVRRGDGPLLSPEPQTPGRGP